MAKPKKGVNPFEKKDKASDKKQGVKENSKKDTKKDKQLPPWLKKK